jgi:hypothetical protein
MAVAHVHLDAADLRRAVEPERHQKFVQQAGMVVVAGVFGIKLPVPADALTVVAEDAHRAVEQAAQLRQHRRTEVILQRLGVIREGAEQRAVDRLHRQPAQPVRRHVEAGVHPALAADTAAERDRLQTAVEAVTPLVIDAGVLGGVARQFAPHHRAAMGAAIDKGVYGAVRAAVHDDRGVADIGGAKIAVVRDLRFETEEIPGRPAEDPLLLALVRLGIVVQPVGHSAVIERRPNLGGQHRPSRGKAQGDQS